MVKRPIEEGDPWENGLKDRQPKKQRRDNKKDQNHEAIVPEEIVSARQIRLLLADYNDARKLHHGINSFRGFLKSCLPVTEGEDAEYKNAYERNLKILWEFSQMDGGTRDDEGPCKELLQAWSFSFQRNENGLLSSIPATLDLIFRVIAPLPDFKKFGIALSKSILEQSYLKILYRSLTQTRDFITGPCLRLLIEINSFDGGSLCSFVHQSFDFTLKELGKNLESKTPADKLQVRVEDPKKPSIRSTFVRFVLSFFRFGPTIVKASIMGVRSFITPLFKFLRADTSHVVKSVLETLLRHIMGDLDISKASKTLFFNEWVLQRVGDLYRRDDTISVGQKETKISEIAHQFLMTVCTTPNNGICFQDSGWYTHRSVVTEAAEEKMVGGKVNNRALSSFVIHLKPHADSLQLELILAIFKVCPELVAKYFSDNESFTFEPKVTATWTGYCGFLSGVLQLPAESGFLFDGNHDKRFSMPPPAKVILENVLPKPLTRSITTKCLAHEVHFIKFLVTRLLNLSFSKLSSALECIDSIASQMADPKPWERTRFALVEEFCKGVPEMPSIIKAFNTSSESGTLFKEGATRLLKNYYDVLPDIALAQKFDLTTVLGNVLLETDESSSGMKLLELKNLLRMAELSSDIKWWNKSTSMAFSPFISILKLSVETELSTPLFDFSAILATFSESNSLFQSETQVSAMEALLSSLHSNKGGQYFDTILRYLDDCSSRCIRSPFKYIDDSMEIAIKQAQSEASTMEGTVYIKPVSPILMTLTEQWKFISSTLKEQPKALEAISRWLSIFIESCYFVGENASVLEELANRLVSSESTSQYFKLLQVGLRRWQNGVAAEEGHDTQNSTGISIFIGSGGIISPTKAKNAMTAMKHKSLSLFDLRVLLKVMTATRDVSEIKNLQNVFREAFVAFSPEEHSQSLRDLILKYDELEDFFQNSSGDELLATDLVIAKCLADISSPDTIPKSLSERLQSVVYNRVQMASTSSPKENIIELLQTIIEHLLTVQQLESLFTSLASLPDSTLRASSLTFAIQTLTALNNSNISFNIIESVLSTKKALPDTIYEITAQHLIFNDNMKDLLIRKDARIIKRLLSGNSAQLQLANSILSKAPQLAWKALDWQSANSTEPEQIIAILEAIFHNSAAFDDASLTCKWNSDIEVVSRKKVELMYSQLDQEISKADPKLLSTLINDSNILQVLQKAVFLMPPQDTNHLLVIMTKLNKLPFSSDAVGFVECCIKAFEGVNVDSYLQSVLRDLINRFSSADEIDGEFKIYISRFALLLERQRFSLKRIIPRAILDTVLEAALSTRIDVAEVNHLVAAIVSECSMVDIDHSKLLQLLLSNERSPLLARAKADEYNKIPCVHLAFVIFRLFSFARARHSNITTLDGVLAIYRGSTDVVDQVLLGIIVFIEAHIAKSCAGRISNWSVGEKTGNYPLVMRNNRGQLEMKINPAVTKGSVWSFSPTNSKIDFSNSEHLGDFMNIQTINEKQNYDLRFFLPAFAFCLISEDQMIDVQKLVQSNCVGFAIMGLCSGDFEIRKMTEAFLGALASKLETSHYRERTQIQHLICATLASLDGPNFSIDNEPIPPLIATFLAISLSVLSNPSHFLYAKIMDMMLKRPYIDLFNIPILESLFFTTEDDYIKEVGWILRILVSGIKTEQDLSIYRKKRIFETVQGIYNTPFIKTNSNINSKVLELLWNAAGVDGGATFLITRSGTLSWIQQQIANAHNDGEKLLLKRLAARLYEGCAKGHVREWSNDCIQYTLASIMEM